MFSVQARRSDDHSTLSLVFLILFPFCPGEESAGTEGRRSLASLFRNLRRRCPLVCASWSDYSRFHIDTVGGSRPNSTRTRGLTRNGLLILYHFVQFDGHASRGPPNRRNVTDVTVILGKCRNHLGSRRNVTVLLGKCRNCLGS